MDTAINDIGKILFKSLEENKDENLFEMQYDLYKQNVYNKILSNTGLTFSYTEDELDIIDNYFRSERNLENSAIELLLRSIFAFYVFDIIKKNNSNVKLDFLEKRNTDPSNPNPISSNDILISIEGESSTIKLFPLVKLGKIAFNKDSDENTLRQWYSMAILTSGFVKF